jgi:hypothetical protein
LPNKYTGITYFCLILIHGKKSVEIRRMKKINSSYSETNGVLIAVPQFYLDSLVENTKEILALLKGKTNLSSQSIGGYVPEEEAQKILGKKTTWFWNMRTKGKLAFSKVGNKIYYSMRDIEGLMDANKKEKFTSLKHN